MSGFLNRLRALVVPAAIGGQPQTPEPTSVDDKIALGVLLWIVADADGHFADEERQLIAQVLTSHGVGQADLAVVMASVEQAAEERIDLYAFTREVASGLTPAARMEIVRHLYRVACADGSVDHEEVEAIRKISGLLRVPHRDMINAKIAAKAEFGL